MNTQEQAFILQAEQAYKEIDRQATETQKLLQKQADEAQEAIDRALAGNSII